MVHSQNNEDLHGAMVTTNAAMGSKGSWWRFGSRQHWSTKMFCDVGAYSRTEGVYHDVNYVFIPIDLVCNILILS